jgi:uncharacterized membrane protein YqaE (UPF0057 family)
MVRNRSTAIWLIRPNRFAFGSTMSQGSSEMDFLRILLSILLPPLGVFFQVGIGLQFWINILLTLLGYIPGVVHAVWIIATRGKGRSS